MGLRALLSLLPAGLAMLALPFGRRSRAGERNVRAVYLFHRSGDPLAMAASDLVPPIEADHLKPVLGAVREFVETSVPTTRGFQLTSRKFGEESLVAVRGRYVSACAVHRGRTDGMLRRELLQFVRDFEARNAEQLGTWEEATSLAGVASIAISGLMDGREPSRAEALHSVATGN